MNGFCEWFLQIKEHVIGIGIDVPFLLLGGPGTGKSSIMARVADVTVSKALLKEIPGYVSIEQQDRSIFHP